MKLNKAKAKRDSVDRKIQQCLCERRIADAVALIGRKHVAERELLKERIRHHETNSH